MPWVLTPNPLIFTGTSIFTLFSQAEDRAMERNFKKEIQEAASNPIDMADMMAQLVQVRQHQSNAPTHLT